MPPVRQLELSRRRGGCPDPAPPKEGAGACSRYRQWFPGSRTEEERLRGGGGRRRRCRGRGRGWVRPSGWHAPAARGRATSGWHLHRRRRAAQSTTRGGGLAGSASCVVRSADRERFAHAHDRGASQAPSAGGAG
eukprot:scaffold2806_cov45-Phaeocystis_antarctica.AAC.2